MALSVIALEPLFKERLKAAEILVAIELDPQPARAASAFFKFMPRGVLEIPTVNTAASVGVDASGACVQARVVVGAVSFQPIVLEAPTLQGRTIDNAAAREAVQGVAASVQTMADVRGSVAYKKAMAVEFAARALVLASRRAREG